MENAGSGDSGSVGTTDGSQSGYIPSVASPVYSG